MGSISGLISKPRLVWYSAALCCMFLFLCVPGAVHSQSMGGDLPMASRPVIYNNPGYDSVVVIEFPFTFNRASLEFFRPDSTDPSYYGRIYAEVILFDSTATPIDTANTYFSVRVENPAAAETTSVMLFNKLGIVVKPGRYSARMSVIDAVSKRSGELFFPSVRAVFPPPGKLALAGPVLAYKVSPVTDSAQRADDRMVRNGVKVLTNPAGIFTTTDTAVAFYAEIYNLSETAELAPSYRLMFAVTDTAGNLVQSFGFVDRPKPGESAVIAESFDLSGWNVGSYRFYVIASDPATAQADTIYVPLHIIPPFPVVAARQTVPTAVTDPYDSLTLQEKEQLARYLLNPDQLSILQRLSESGKETFLQQFWLENDIDPTTTAIENRTELIRRFKYANQHFSVTEGRRDGWATDRGRVYISYGPWDERDDYPAPRVGNPFSIWYYHALEKGVVFVFEDERSDNEYRLVHSTAKGERYNKTWADYLVQSMTDIQSEEAPTRDKDN